MRTIDRVSDPAVSAPSATCVAPRAETLLRRLVSIPYRLLTRGKNRTADLSSHQLRDIGLEPGAYRGASLDRAARQDALLRDAQAQALLLARNIGSR
ncbi:hypothetical protein [Affinirhizobium pseudoryzae]|uniref:hypothetical protein n=1 Tax=Allorhizobium pseudoryzae TaxID=379684 RepID=UPI0013EB69D4|nr:hypothetical protein [Allorhizobium pseudoryzae]